MKRFHEGKLKVCKEDPTIWAPEVTEFSLKGLGMGSSANTGRPRKHGLEYPYRIQLEQTHFHSLQKCHESGLSIKPCYMKQEGVSNEIIRFCPCYGIPEWGYTGKKKEE